MINITGLVLTRNEAPNIARTLGKLTWLPEVVVVDSQSTDGTQSIAAGFSNVRVVERPFTTHAEQWNFGLEDTSITTEWVLALDADFVLSDAVIAEVQSLTPAESIAGYWASFQYCIDGQPLRGAAYPPVAVLYRRLRGRYDQDGHTQRIRLNGELLRLEAPVMHDDRKSLTHWLASQASYMALEAEKLSNPTAQIGFVDQARRFLVIAPPAMFCYCYFVRGGILDGKAGLFYALQRAVSEAILSLFLVRRMLGRAG
jgi:glycosyltransferase involved in cell wall biosynthesis